MIVEWSSCAWEVYGIYKERGDRTKLNGTDNAHKRTLQANGDGNNYKKLFSYMLSDASAVEA